MQVHVRRQKLEQWRRLVQRSCIVILKGWVLTAVLENTSLIEASKVISGVRSNLSVTEEASVVVIL